MEASEKEMRTLITTLLLGENKKSQKYSSSALEKQFSPPKKKTKAILGQKKLYMHAQKNM